MTTEYVSSFFKNKGPEGGYLSWLPELIKNPILNEGNREIPNIDVSNNPNPKLLFH